MINPANASPYNSSIEIDQTENESSLVPIPLMENQASFVRDVFKSQEQQKIYLANQLKSEILEKEKLEIENQKQTNMLLRNADALIHSIIHKFIGILNNSPDLQSLLQLKTGHTDCVDAAVLIERMGKLLDEEVPPDEFTKDPILSDFVWCPRRLEMLQPIFDDMEQFLKLFGINDVSSQCPKLIEKVLEDQIRLGLKPEVVGSKKLHIAATLLFIADTLKNTALVGGVALVILKSPTMVLVQFVAKALFKILVSFVL